MGSEGCCFRRTSIARSSGAAHDSSSELRRDGSSRQRAVACATQTGVRKCDGILDGSSRSEKAAFAVGRQIPRLCRRSLPLCKGMIRMSVWLHAFPLRICSTFSNMASYTCYADCMRVNQAGLTEAEIVSRRRHMNPPEHQRIYSSILETKASKPLSGLGWARSCLVSQCIGVHKNV